MMRSQFVAAGVPRFTLTVIDGVVYGRVGQFDHPPATGSARQSASGSSASI